MRKIGNRPGGGRVPRRWCLGVFGRRVCVGGYVCLVAFEGYGLSLGPG